MSGLKRLLLVVFLLTNICTIAQRKEINYHDLKAWQRLGRYDMSKDGKYIWYESLSIDKDSLIIASTKNNYRISFFKGYDATFVGTTRIVFRQTDCVVLFDLFKKSPVYFENARRFVLSPLNYWIAVVYDSSVVVKGLMSGIEYKLDAIDRFFFNHGGEFLIFEKNKTVVSLNLKTGNKHLIFNGALVSDITFQDSTDSYAFIGEKSNGHTALYGGSKFDTVCQLNISEDSKSVDFDCQVAGATPWFSTCGRFLFFKIKGQNYESVNDRLKITDKVNVWSYKDKNFQSQQLLSYSGELNREYTAVYSFQSNQIMQLENADSVLIGKTNGQYVIKKNITNEDDAYWNEQQRSVYRLKDLKMDMTYQFMPDSANYLFLNISPRQRYILFLDTSLNHIYCYDISLHEIINLTSRLPTNAKDTKENRQKSALFTFAGWNSDESALFIYDKYDVWLVDVKSKSSPLCITNKYGERNGIFLRLACEPAKLNLGDSVLLAGLDEITKSNGFFLARMGNIEDPVKLNFGPYVQYFPGLFFGNPRQPIKSDESRFFLFQRQSDTLAPNLYITNDFKKLRQLSFFYPHRNYNWVTSTLVRWTSKDGFCRNGILYKPQDFDSTKKYPIIFNYYELRSNECFKYQQPELSIGALNIPWYVSRGYLVFVPDICGEATYRADNAYLSVVSAAEFLIEKYAWIDRNRMGLQGHSFGGFETNYIVTRTNIFAAAQSSAGPVDLISEYGGIGFGGKSLAALHEVGQHLLRSTPWDSPNVYIRMSPIFGVKLINTPILLLHNSKDVAVPFSQSIEFFTALRRLKKKVWLLEYDEQDHTLGEFESIMDFTLRQQQFFDYYLKDMHPPVWMTTGIPAYNKGKVSGLKIDSSGIKP